MSEQYRQKPLDIEDKHIKMMLYADRIINDIPNKQKYLKDTMRNRMFSAWDLIGEQEYEKDRYKLLLQLDKNITSLKRFVRFCYEAGYLKGSDTKNSKSETRYKTWASMLVEEGKIIGGMLKKTNR